MLVNLSNHKHASWGAEQQSVAQEQWDTVVDIPFPAVRAGASTLEVTELARETTRRILAMHPDAALVQGESTLAFAVVYLLQWHGLPCFAATTPRISTERMEGSVIVKESHFQFGGFRQFPKLAELAG